MASVTFIEMNRAVRAAGVAGAADRVLAPDGPRPLGTSDSSTGQYAFVYDSTTGIVTPLSYPGDTITTGRALSGDGSTVVGDGSVAGVWVSVNRATPQLLGTMLAALGVDLSGFTLSYALDISENGKVIVGIGYQAGAAADEGWIAVLP
jgi:uncharacterized membrane protein